MTEVERLNRWTSKRSQISDLLGEKDSDAAELYRIAVNGLVGPLSRASLMVSAHCIRELIKILPVILGYPVVERADASRAARELHSAWTGADLPLAPGSPEGEVVSVPVSVYAAARDVANAGAKGAKNSRELTALIVTGQVGEADTASVARVHESIEMFRGLAHARDYTKPARPVPSEDHLLQELEIIEETLLNRMANMADRAKTVRELLAAANRKVDEANP